MRTTPDPGRNRPNFPRFAGICCIVLTAILIAIFYIFFFCFIKYIILYFSTKFQVFLNIFFKNGCEGKTRTYDLWVMSPTSCQLLHLAIFNVGFIDKPTNLMEIKIWSMFSILLSKYYQVEPSYLYALTRRRLPTSGNHPLLAACSSSRAIR